MAGVYMYLQRACGRCTVRADGIVLFIYLEECECYLELLKTILGELRSFGKPAMWSSFIKKTVILYIT